MLLEFNSLLCLMVFMILLVYYYVKYVSPFKNFPTASLLPVVLKLFITTRFIKDVPVASQLFNLSLAILKKYQAEGVALIWLVKPYLLIFGEEAVQVLSNERSALDKITDYKVLQQSFGLGLITSNGELWRNRRKMFDPAFTTRVMKNSVSIINNNSAVLVKKLADVQEKSPEHVLKSIKFCAFSNVYECVIGLRLNDPKKCQDSERFLDNITKATHMVVYQWFHPWIRYKCMLKLFASGRAYLRQLKEIRFFMEKVLQEIMDSVMSSNVEEKSKYEDEFHHLRQRSFSQVLVHNHLADPSFTENDMMDQLMTFISAGYDTAAYGLMWCLFLLGHHPEIQNKVFKEVQDVVEDKDVSYEDQKNLTYLECVIKECLRLYPPTPIQGRYVQKDVKCGQYVIPKGTNILLCAFMAHRDPAVYPDPEVFNPARFLDDNSERASKSLIIFSEGIRNCIGKKFAMMQIKIVLAHVIRNFKITSLDRPEDISLTWEVTLGSTKPLRMHFIPRQ